MLSLLKRLARTSLASILKIRARRQAAILCKSAGAVQLLGEALSEALQETLSPIEEQWIKKIEKLRHELYASKEILSINDFEAAQSGKIEIEKISVGDVSSGGSNPYLWSLILFKLIKKFKPLFCLELGTCVGISASFQAAALKINGSGRILTIDGAKELTEFSKENFSSLDLDNIIAVSGRFQDILMDQLKKYKKFDYALIDGHHDEKATLVYFEQILPFMTEQAVIIFDDISWSAGMKKAWTTITADERIKIAVDLNKLGICIINNTIQEKKIISISLV